MNTNEHGFLGSADWEPLQLRLAEKSAFIGVHLWPILFALKPRQESQEDPMVALATNNSVAPYNSLIFSKTPAGRLTN